MEATLLEAGCLSRDGRPWQPSYLLEIDAKTCIGCGRCFKVCGRAVLDMRGITEDGELVSLDDDEEIERKIMTVADSGACIGCAACGRVCPKGCQTHGSA